MDDKIFKEIWQDKVEIVISDDKTEAYLMLKEDLKDVSVEEVIELLNYKKIIYGIDAARIAVMINSSELFTPVLVAKGSKPEEGNDGYYNFYFNTEPVKKPIILEDGTVDYNTLGSMIVCKENELLVEYHPAKEGSDGMSVLGSVIPAKRVKELTALRGKGFKSVDNQYYASFDGKIEYENSKLKITQVYIIDGDLDSNSSDITFHGDVLVTGNVSSGKKIDAVGNITVNGSVEVATLIAGKNIILRNGMQGNSKGYVYAKGDVSAKFFEQTTVVCKGNINANAIMNCEMNSDKEIIVAGKRGALIGGKYTAIEKISASTIGNAAQLETKLIIGMDDEYYERLDSLKAEIEALKEEIDDLDRRLLKIGDRLKKSPNGLLMDSRNSLIKEKVENVTRHNEFVKQREEILSQRERSVNGTVVAKGKVFPNTTVSINGVSDVLNDLYRNVTIMKKDGRIRIFSNTFKL